MTGSAIIDLPTLFVSVLALLVMWDVLRTTIVLVLQVVSLLWAARIHLSATKASQCEPATSPSQSHSSSP